MEEPRLIVATVVWNHRERLPLLLRSLDDQTRRPDQTVLVDAASHDGVSTWLAQAYPYVSTLRLFQHHGLSHAWRQAAKFALQRIPAAEQAHSWIFFVSPETLLAKDACALLLKEVTTHPEVGAIGPAVLRAWYQGEGDDGMEQIEPTELVESLGFELTKSFGWRHRGQGGSLRMHDPEATEVFALSSAAVLYRADHLVKALDLEALSFPWRTVDALFFDLGWRVRWLGVDVRLMPGALAWRVERKGDGTKVTTWSERVAAEEDRRHLVDLHLLGLGIRFRTWPRRWWAAIRVWPYRFWGWLARRHEASAVTGQAWKIGQRVLRQQHEKAFILLKNWLFVTPLTRTEKRLESEVDPST